MFAQNARFLAVVIFTQFSSAVISSSCGNCDTVRYDSSGCDVTDIKNCVCAIDSFCCRSVWDEVCVDLAYHCGCESGEPDRKCDDGLLNSEHTACCPTECGQCGGDGCDERPGGATNCCMASILTSGRMCDQIDAPCILETSDPTCLDGILNANKGVCCSEECVKCGGEFCDSRIPDNSATECCASVILEDGCSCNEFSAPCFLPCLTGDIDRSCENGIKNEEQTVCCPTECGQCGGDGCQNRPGGARDCCMGSIVASGLVCNETEAPCILETADPTCSDGILNAREGVCCSSACGICGGEFCDNRIPGGGDSSQECCVIVIIEEGFSCDEFSPPCVISPGRDLPCFLAPSNVPILPDSPFYNQCRVVFNPRIDFFPAAIILVKTAQDVVEAISYAKSNSLPIRVRSGGHSYEGFSVQSGGLVIDVSRRKAVTVSDDRTLAVIQSGVQLLEAYELLWEHRVAISGGSCPSVGIAGLTTGGGLGLEMRLFGLTIDRLTRIQIVTPDGQIRDATEEQDELLYWASRGGGGGNFGVITEFEFLTFPVDMVTIFQIEYEWSAEAMAQLISTWQTFVLSADFPNELYQNMYLPAEQNGFFYSSGQCYCEPEEVEMLLNQYDFLTFGNAVFSTPPQSVTFIESKLYFGGVDINTTDARVIARVAARAGFPDVIETSTSNAKHSSVIFTEDLTNVAIETIVESLSVENTPQATTAILIDPWRGQIQALEATDTAFFYRSALASAQILACYPEDSAENVETDVFLWVETTRTSLLPFGDGAYRNYADKLIIDWPQRYYGENYQRLQQAKLTYDPENWFNYPQSVELPEGTTLPSGGDECGDCITPQTTPGCSVESIEKCVCETDGYCCQVAFDEVCVKLAIKHCSCRGPCYDSCGGQSKIDDCFCDESCMKQDDCCFDVCQSCDICDDGDELRRADLRMSQHEGNVYGVEGSSSTSSRGMIVVASAACVVASAFAIVMVFIVRRRRKYGRIKTTVTAAVTDS